MDCLFWGDCDGENIEIIENTPSLDVLCPSVVRDSPPAFLKNISKLALESTILSSFLFVCAWLVGWVFFFFGATLAVLRAYSLFCAQELLLLCRVRPA